MFITYKFFLNSKINYNLYIYPLCQQQKINFYTYIYLLIIIYFLQQTKCVKTRSTCIKFLNFLNSKIKLKNF